jgi:hypothetical protein
VRQLDADPSARSRLQRRGVQDDVRLNVRAQLQARVSSEGSLVAHSRAAARAGSVSRTGNRGTARRSSRDDSGNPDDREGRQISAHSAALTLAVSGWARGSAARGRCRGKRLVATSSSGPSESKAPSLAGAASLGPREGSS